MSQPLSQIPVNDSILEINDNLVIHPEKIFEISNSDRKGDIDQCFNQDPKNILNANMEPKDKKDNPLLGKRTFSQTTTEIKKRSKDKLEVKSVEEKFGSDYEVGDCLMSVKGNDLDENYQSSDD